MIKTGKTPLPVMTYIAILAVCFIINLPGIAIAPIEGKLMKELHTSELEIQLLTTLPNFVIIPFVFISGKLSLSRHKILYTYISLIIFLGCGIAYLMVKSMTGLIITSCLLGVGSGILIPFAMGFIVNSFDGKYRTKNLGIKSATSNFGTVVAAFIIGFLVDKPNWHLPFVVYLIAALPLLLAWWLRYIPGFGNVPLVASPYQINDSVTKVSKGIDGKKITGLIINNVCLTFITFVIVIYLPQLIEQKNWNPKTSAYIITVFFIAVLSSGFFLSVFLKTLKSYVFPVLGCLVTIGLAFIVFIPSIWGMYVGSILAGISFGFFQPLIYDKTSYAICDPKLNIFGLSLVLTALYFAIAVEPFLVTAIVKIFRIRNENDFVFYLNFFLAIAYTIAAFFLRKKFTFSIEEDYYK